MTPGAGEYEETVERARRINRTWITRGDLAENAERYLDHLAAQRPGVLAEVCRRATGAARAASKAQRDPKPAFYAALFSAATREERNRFLRDHFFTRLLSAEIQLAGGEGEDSPRT